MGERDHVRKWAPAYLAVAPDSDAAGGPRRPRQESLRSPAAHRRAGRLAPTGLLPLYLAVGALFAALGLWVLLAAPQANLHRDGAVGPSKHGAGGGP